MMTMRVVFIAPTLTEYSLFSGIVGEAALAFILVVLSTVGMIWLTARIFRVGILMYGKRPTLPEIVRWVKY
jgi:ABC-2 type transport system permease protein